MDSKLKKFSLEELEKRLAKMEKGLKIIDVLFICSIILAGISLLLGIFEEIGILIFIIILKFVIYPIGIGNLKTEINNRKEEMNQSLISNSIDEIKN